jgi:hypothetical protein
LYTTLPEEAYIEIYESKVNWRVKYGPGGLNMAPVA